MRGHSEGAGPDTKGGSTHLADDFSDALERLLDGVLGHVPLKPGQVGLQPHCSASRWQFKETKPLDGLHSSRPLDVATHLET